MILDDPITIEKCLNCKRPECNDCVRYTTAPKYRRKGITPNMPVAQYDREGNHIKTYPSRAAAGIALGISPQMIGKAIYGKAKTAGGYVWKNA